jgi:hypothetical protein
MSVMPPVIREGGALVEGLRQRVDYLQERQERLQAELQELEVKLRRDDQRRYMRNTYLMVFGLQVPVAGWVLLIAMLTR